MSRSCHDFPDKFCTVENDSLKMVRILHLSYDYSDKPNDKKTIAVRALVDQTRKIADVKVISLDRVIRFGFEETEVTASGDLAIKSFGLPYSLFFQSGLYRTYKTILKADREGLIDLHAIDLIHAHKITFEGYVGYLLSRKLDVPLFVSIRQTDILLLRARPDLRYIARRIMASSSKIFYIVPYMVESIKKILGKNFFENHIKEKLVFLPNIVERRMNPGHSHSQKGVLLTALHMTRKTVKRKNIKNLLRAISNLKRRDLMLHVIGGGDYLTEVKEWAKKYQLISQVKFLGSISNSEMDRYFAESAAFVLPSYSETFGYVYAEALLNGTPILYSKGTGFDGMFENVGVAVDPHSPRSIEKGLIELIEKNDFFRAEILKLQGNNAFHIFRPDKVRDRYLKCLQEFFKATYFISSRSQSKISKELLAL